MRMKAARRNGPGFLESGKVVLVVIRSLRMQIMEESRDLVGVRMVGPGMFVDDMPP